MTISGIPLHVGSLDRIPQGFEQVFDDHTKHVTVLRRIAKHMNSQPVEYFVLDDAPLGKPVELVRCYLATGERLERHLKHHIDPRWVDISERIPFPE